MSDFVISSMLTPGPHARRHLYAALHDYFPEAVCFISQIRRLYRIEDEARAMTTARHDFRQQHAPAIWEALKGKAEELQPTLLPKSRIGQALGYFLKEYDALVGYLRDGRFEIDDNLIENDIRPHRVGLQAVALHRSSRRRLAERRPLFADRELSSTRPESPRLSDRCPPAFASAQDHRDCVPPAGSLDAFVDRHQLRPSTSLTRSRTRREDARLLCLFLCFDRNCYDMYCADRLRLFKTDRWFASHYLARAS
jgi:hypothetical protein